MSPSKPSRASAELLARTLAERFAPWVREIGLELLEAHDGEVRLRLPVTAPHVHGGGVLCGQTMMAAADTSMVLAAMTTIGDFRPMTTVQLQTSFLRPVPGDAGEVAVVARVLRMGRQLVFGEIEIQDRDGRLVAHATTTYALL